jgi:hypothetical protein
VHAANRLPLNQGAAGQLVIPSEEMRDLDRRPTLAEQSGHATGLFMNVSNYLEHHATLQESPLDRWKGVPTMCQLALSPGGESA